MYSNNKYGYKYINIFMVFSVFRGLFVISTPIKLPFNFAPNSILMAFAHKKMVSSVWCPDFLSGIFIPLCLQCVFYCRFPTIVM